MSEQTLANRPLPRCFTVDELAAAAGVIPDTIRSAIRRREIEAVRIGRLWRIPQREYERLTGTSGQV